MNIERFAKLAFERHAIYIKKQIGAPKPWTKDHVLQEYFFCNVFRELDKTSKWIMEFVADPLMDDDNLWQSLMIARYISRIDTLEDMYKCGAFNPFLNSYERRQAGAACLLKRREEGLPINTSAFITNPAVLEKWGPTKVHYLMRLCKTLEEADIASALSKHLKMKDVHTGLQSYYGIGSFMAYQYVCDFSYIPRYLMNADDKYSWSSEGPGSMRGMKRVLGMSLDATLYKEDWLEQARRLFVEWEKYIAENLPSFSTSLFCELPGHESVVKEEMARFYSIRMQDVQHWLCEYDKWERGGSKKRRYDGGAP